VIRRPKQTPARDGVWWAGLVVAAAAAAATAHGLYAVAAASDVPWPVAVLYPVMTDGLALVAYSATNRLTGGARRYAWSVVIAAAGLSGAAQALYLAGGGLDDAPTAVRFGIGAAPALAAAAVAHLLHLIRTAGAVQPVRPLDAQPPRTERPALRERADRPGDVPAGAAERAHRAALAHRAEHGSLPTASTLVRLTGVSRGTAGTVLKGLRETTENSPPRAEPDQSLTTPEKHPTHDQNKIHNHHTPMHHDPEEVRPPAEAGR
jgi:hypothetical protein